EREVQRAQPEALADDERPQPPDDQEERDRLHGPAATQPDARGHESHARGEHDHDRLVDELELRHAVVELALEGRQADEEAAGRPAVGRRRSTPSTTPSRPATAMPNSPTRIG